MLIASYFTTLQSCSCILFSQCTAVLYETYNISQNLKTLRFSYFIFVHFPLEGRKGVLYHHTACACVSPSVLPLHLITLKEISWFLWKLIQISRKWSQSQLQILQFIFGTIMNAYTNIPISVSIQLVDLWRLLRNYFIWVCEFFLCLQLNVPRNLARSLFLCVKSCTHCASTFENREWTVSSRFFLI